MFIYTGQYQVDFNDKHPLLIYMLIEGVASERSAGKQDYQYLVWYLRGRFDLTYENNKEWANKILNGSGNDSRDILLSFLNHWVDAVKAKNN